MQRFELKMLKTSESVLDKVNVIYTEVRLKSTYENAPNYSIYKNWLNQKGYNAIIKALPENWDMSNVLFVKNLNDKIKE